MKKLYGLSNDYVFKKIMNEPNLCRILLKDVFDIDIENFEYVDKESVKENKHLSYGICDIVVKNNKEIIIIEMQNRNNYNIENRSMMYLSKMYSKQWKSKDYKKLKPVTICLILNYPYSKNELQEYQMLEIKIHKKFGNNLKVKIWNTTLDSENDITRKYKKILEPTNLEDLKETELESFVKVLLEYNMDVKEYEKMKEVEFMNWTMEDEILLCQATAYQDGIEEGLIEGKKEGLIEGKKEGLIEGKKEFIKNMIEGNFSMDEIVRATKISRNDIQKYVNEFNFYGN